MYYVRRNRIAGSNILPGWHKVMKDQHTDPPYTNCNMAVIPGWERRDTEPPHQKVCWQCFGKGHT